MQNDNVGKILWFIIRLHSLDHIILTTKQDNSMPLETYSFSVRFI